MRSVSDRVYVTTDDGSYGHHGFVTNVLEELLKEGQKIDIVLAVGPVPMMRAVSNLTKNYNVHTMVSLNPIMVDGTGMCGSCRVTIKGKNQFVVRGRGRSSTATRSTSRNSCAETGVISKKRRPPWRDSATTRAKSAMTRGRP